MALKEKLLKTIESARKLAEECPQTIEVRSALKKLELAHGFVSQSNIVAKEKVEKKTEPTEAKKDTKKGGVQKK